MLICVGLIPKAHQFSTAILELREVIHARLRLVVRQTTARVQLHSLDEKEGWQLNSKELEKLDTLEGQLQVLLRCHPIDSGFCQP